MTRRLLVLSALTLLGLAPAHAQFFDQGFVNPAIRTDYDATNEGTAANPLSYDRSCLYSDNSDPILLAPGCYVWGPSTFLLSNHFSQRSNPNGFWVISANNEIHNKLNFFYDGWDFVTSPANTGPPNQSHPIAIPQTLNNMFELTLLTNSLPGEQLWRAHMIADHTPYAYQNPQGAAGIPFLGIGADVRRGNGQMVGKLNTASGYDTTHSTVRIWNAANSIDGAALMYTYAIAQWPDSQGKMVPRIVFVALYHEGLEHSSSSLRGLHRHWNWKMPDSFFYPGGDIAFIDAEDINTHCPGHPSIDAIGVWQDTAITTDWENLFRCMSDNYLFDEPMPSTPVDLLGVHWAVEVAGPDSLIWGSVHGMAMSTGGSSAVALGGAEDASKRVGPMEIPADWEDPVTTDEIRSWFWESCRANDACWQNNALRAAGEPYDPDYASGRFHTEGVARDLAPWPKTPQAPASVDRP